MLEILQFVFSSFWVFAGTVVLLIIITHGLSIVVSTLVIALARVLTRGPGR